MRIKRVWNLLLIFILIAHISEADTWVLNFIERDTSPWWRGGGSPTWSGSLSIYVGNTLVKNFSSISSDYDYGNITLNLSSNDPTGQTIKLAFYGNGIEYLLYNINLKKNGQYAKFTPFTISQTTGNEYIHYDNSWKEDRIVATLENNGWVNFTSATVTTASELEIKQSNLVLNKTIHSITNGDVLNITANVTNIGSATDNGVTVKLYINDVLNQTSSSSSIANGSSANFSFLYTANFNNINRIKITIEAVPSGTEGMVWNNNATKYILKHPYFYITDFTKAPVNAYAGQAPYSAWNSSLSTYATSDLSYNYANPSAYEDVKAQKAMEMSLYGNINNLTTYQNTTMTALLNIGNGNWCWFNRSFAGNTAEGTGGTWSLYNSSCHYDDTGADWGIITEGYAMAYDWDAQYIISYDISHGTAYYATIRDKLARICLDSYLTDKEIYAYPEGGDRNSVDNWGDWGTGKLAKEGGTGVCAMALLDYDGQYQDVDRMDEAVKFVEQNLFKQDSKMTGAPESILQIQTTEDGIWEEGSGYQDYHEPTTSYFMALYKSTFNKSLSDTYPLAYGYATWLLRTVAPTGQYPQMTTSYACAWSPQLNYYLMFNPESAEYSLGTYFTNYSILTNDAKGYRQLASCGGDYGGYPELLLGYNKSASMATPAEPSYFFTNGTGAVLRSGYDRNATYVYLRSAQNHTMSGHSAGTTQQLVFDIWAKGAYLIPEAGDPRFLGDPEDDQASRIGRTTMLVNCSTCNWVGSDGWTAIERGTKGSYGSMNNPSYITNSFTSSRLDLVEGNMTVSHYQNISGSDAYTTALPFTYSWTRSLMLIDNNYIISLDKLTSASSRQWAMTIPFGDTNGNIGGGGTADNYAWGNLTIDGTNYQWYDRTPGSEHPTPFSVSNAQKIIWNSRSETNAVDTTAFPVNMTLFLNPSSNVDFIDGHMHYGTYGVGAEWNIPIAEVKQSGIDIKYLTLYYPTGLGDTQPTISNLTVTGGSGNDYATRLEVGNKIDIITFSDGESITVGPLSTDAQLTFSRDEIGLKYFYIRYGKKFSYNNISRIELSNNATRLLYTYNGENRYINISGVGYVEITLNDLRPDFTYIVNRGGSPYTNWHMNNGSSMTITTTLSEQSFEIIANGNYPPSITLNSPANNANLNYSNVSFNCSASDESGLANISLWNNITGWKEVAVDSVSGNSTSKNWTVSNITEGIYAWNCRADDILGAYSFASSNRTFTIFFTPTECNESWNCSAWSECTNGNQTRVCVDLNNCNTTLNKPSENQSCSPGGCTENWTCTSWSSCVNNQETRTCVDSNSCNTTINKPSENQSCVPGTCSENWRCTGWSACTNNQQTRTCTDANNCGTTVNKPSESQSCSSGGYPGGGYSGGGTVGCYESWSCGTWSECIDDQQNRTCSDANRCGTSKYRPPQTQPCISQLEIKNLPELIRINNGSSTNFTINAYVNGTANNVTVNLTGIPHEWYLITPREIVFAKDQAVDLAVNISIPSNASGNFTLYFQLLSSRGNSQLNSSLLKVVVPTAETCNVVCNGYAFLDKENCRCICTLSCEEDSKFNPDECICEKLEIVAPLRNISKRAVKFVPEPAQGFVAELITFGLLLLVQLIWAVPLSIIIWYLTKKK